VDSLLKSIHQPAMGKRPPKHRNGRFFAKRLVPWIADGGSWLSVLGQNSVRGIGIPDFISGRGAVFRRARRSGKSRTEKNSLRVPRAP